MKKAFIFAATAALALAACSKNEIIETINKVPEEVAIGFSNYTPNAVTKADNSHVDGTALVEDKTFAVYAWQTDHESWLTANPGDPTFMSPAVVTWHGDTTDGDGNTYTPTRYWPSGDSPKELSFAAYYPYGALGIGAPSFAASGDGGVGTYSFTVQSTPADMVDFCVADVVNDQEYGHTNAGDSYKQTVKFTFKHQLTKVQFQFKTIAGLANTTVIELTNAQLTGIKNTGTLKASYAQAASPAVNTIGTTTTEWSDVSGNGSYQLTVNSVNPASSPIVLTATASEVNNNDIFLMVPQDMAATTQTLNLTWRVRVYDNGDHATSNSGTAEGGLLSETINTKALSLYSNLVTSDSDDTSAYAINWGMNQFITYTITIGPKPIYFTGTVNAWGEQNGYFSVN
mgnify:CR=1 FL=1